jgi:eukaryotic-like serine/threonine-protein kinase
MSDLHLLQPQFSTTPSDPGPVAQPIPEDILADAVRRLRLVCVVWMVLWGVAIIFNLFYTPWLHLPVSQFVIWSNAADVMAAGCILVSALVYHYAPRACRRPETFVHLAIAYEVVLALAIGVINQWEPKVLVGRLSWICALILLYPMIVPMAPRKVLIGSLLAASMDPVGLLVAWARGLELPAFSTLAWAYFPNYICAGLAVIPSQVLSRLSHKVSRAREMGSYRLGALIGKGGMGEVWQARHRFLARPAAIKLIRTEQISGANSQAMRLALQRFRREAEAAASLRSPHTIQLYDFGEMDDHRFYLVMEMLEGIDLESLVHRFGPQRPGRVIHILRQACQSLAEAHSTGLVHRDIKPSNLYLSRLGLEYDFVKVLDFGLVKHETASASAETLVTAPEMAAGTPAYMPPEVVTGEPIDGRLDLYGLGCVGYFLLTGGLVFEADNSIRMIGEHLRTVPVPPSLRCGRPIPEDLDQVILACLAKQPADRPASAEVLERSLAAIESDPWSQEEARAWWRSYMGQSLEPSPMVFSTPTTRVAAPLGL